MSAARFSVHEYVAVVGLHVGEPREIHFDVMQHTSNGVIFARLDGSSSFISDSLIADIDVVKAEPIAGTA